MLVADSNYSLGGDNFWLHNGLQGFAAQWWDAKALRPGVNAYTAIPVLYNPSGAQCALLGPLFTKIQHKHPPPLPPYPHARRLDFSNQAPLLDTLRHFSQLACWFLCFWQLMIWKLVQTSNNETFHTFIPIIKSNKRWGMHKAICRGKELCFNDL